MKVKKKLITAAVAAMCLNSAYGTDLLSHNFNDGEIYPWVECTTKSPSYTAVEDGRVVTYWAESGYDESRSSKGAEACAADDDFQTTKEGWMGFIMNIDESHRDDTESGVAQIFQFVDDSDIYTWTGMLKYAYGDLTIVRRSGKNTSSQVESVIVEDFNRGQDYEIIIHYVLSNEEAGEIEVWIDGELAFSVYDIDFGFGNWTDDDEQYDDTYVELKFGHYDYDNSNYETDEERIIYYDNMTWYNGSDGYDVVNPAERPVVHMTKRNASDYALDGNWGGEDGQDVYLWSADTSNVNQKWYEVYRGNGFYSYQKYDTEYCLDGNNGGENEQNVYLWNCDASNYNQHWERIEVSDGIYRLEKRNAPDYSIDGDNSGANGQNVYLYESDDSNKNQQWIFDYL